MARPPAVTLLPGRPPPGRNLPDDARTPSGACRSTCLRVVARPVPVDDDDRLVAQYPRVVAPWQRGDVSGLGDDLGAVVHADRQPAAHVVLEMRSFAAVGIRDRLDIVRPAPPRLQHQP